MAKVNMVPADLFVKSNLTYQPKTVVSRFRKFVQKQDGYNVGMRQDFEKNKVEIQLLSREFIPNAGGYQTLQTRYVPVASSVKAYKQATKEMIKAERKAVTPPEARKSPLTRVLEFLGI